MVKKAVIVAAGLSSRLYPLTLEMPKVLLPAGGQELILRSLALLRENGIEETAVVAGYRKEQVAAAVGNRAVIISNPFYKYCNNMGSLWFAKGFVGDGPFLYLHGDLVYDGKLLSLAREEFAAGENDMELVTEFGRTDAEAMKVRVDRENYLLESKKEIPPAEAAGEWTGIAGVRCSQELFIQIEKTLFSEGLNFYDTYAFTALARRGFKICCRSTRNLPWIEIDDAEDYKRAKEMFGV